VEAVAATPGDLPDRVGTLWRMLHLAVAEHERRHAGGPGDRPCLGRPRRRIINHRFYTMLVLLALVTSVIAGTWLEAVLRLGRGLLTDEPADPRHRATIAV